MHRREMLLTAGAAVIGLSAFPLGWAAAADNKKQKILYYTKSAGFVHPEVDRKKTDGKLSRSEKLLTEWGEKSGFEVVCSQDPDIFDGDLDQFDAIRLLHIRRTAFSRAKEKIARCHYGGQILCRHPLGFRYLPQTRQPGNRSIHRHGRRRVYKTRRPTKSEKSPCRSEISRHARPRRIYRVVRRMVYIQKIRQGSARNPGARDRRHERPDLSAPPFPATWAHLYGKGRVFYTSMGHRQDIWTNKIFQQIILGGIAWALGNAKADIPPNIDQVTPEANTLPK